jgi:hypothetical protein
MSNPPLNTISRATDQLPAEGKNRTKTPAPITTQRTRLGAWAMGDDARFAVPKEPLQKAAHQGAFCFTATTHVFVREVRSDRDTRIAGAEPV